MITVLDASAAVAVALNKSINEETILILKNSEYIIAPDIFVSEVTNTFWKYHQFDDLPVLECEFLLNNTLKLVDEIIESKTLYKEAFAFSCQVGHSIYDILYLITARRHNALLLSLDVKLNKIAKKHSIKTI